MDEDDYIDWADNNKEQNIEDFFNGNTEVEDLFEKFCWEKYNDMLASRADYLSEMEFERRREEQGDEEWKL